MNTSENEQKEHPVNETISPNDTMFRGNKEHYFYVSGSAMRCIDIAALCANITTGFSKILDLPCGYGRVLRSIKSRFFDSKIVACDLEYSAVDFCVNTFNVDGVYSKPDISELEISEKFDLIWCGSLITHLSECKTRQLLDFFIERLERLGVLVITFHGRYAKYQQAVNPYLGDPQFDKIIEDYNMCGYGYSNYDNQSEYGISVIDPSWFIKYIGNREDITLLYLSEKMWDKHHDVLALQKKEIGSKRDS